MTAQNDITKDRIANVKGDKKLYDKGWDAIFGKKCNTDVKENSVSHGGVETEVIGYPTVGI